MPQQINITPLATQTALIMGLGLSLAATGDIATFTLPAPPAGFSRYIIVQLRVSGASGNISTGVVGVWTGANETGVNVVAQTATGITTGADGTNGNANALPGVNSNTQVYTPTGFPQLFLHVSTAVAGTANFVIQIIWLP
jgi:hypothetical protein